MRVAQADRSLQQSRRTPAAVSVGELLMTRRMSAVAVCCSSDSVTSALRAWSSLNSRTFSIAITAWSAKVLSSAICLSENGSGRRANDVDRADRVEFPQHRRAHEGAKPSFFGSLFGHRTNPLLRCDVVRNLHHLPAQYGSRARHACHRRVGWERCYRMTVKAGLVTCHASRCGSPLTSRSVTFMPPKR